MKDILTQGYRPTGDTQPTSPPSGGSSVMQPQTKVDYVYMNMDQRSVVSKEELETYAKRNPYGWWVNRENQFGKGMIAYGIKNYTLDNVNALAIFYGVYAHERNFTLQDTIHTSR